MAPRIDPRIVVGRSLGLPREDLLRWSLTLDHRADVREVGEEILQLGVAQTIGADGRHEHAPLAYLTSHARCAEP